MAPRRATISIAIDAPSEQLLGNALGLDDEADVETFFAFVIACYDQGDAAPDCARRWEETCPRPVKRPLRRKQRSPESTLTRR